MQMWLGSVTASRIFPTLNVTAHLKTLFCYREEFITHPAATLRARHGGNLQRASPNLWVSVFRSLFIVFHCILHCHCSVSTLFIVLNGFGVSGLKRNSNHKLERRDDPFKLRENGTNGFGAETQPQPQTILKSKRNRKTQNGLWRQFFERKRKHRESQI